MYTVEAVMISQDINAVFDLFDCLGNALSQNDWTLMFTEWQTPYLIDAFSLDAVSFGNFDFKDDFYDIVNASVETVALVTGIVNLSQKRVKGVQIDLGYETPRIIDAYTRLVLALLY